MKRGETQVACGFALVGYNQKRRMIVCEREAASDLNNLDRHASKAG